VQKWARGAKVERTHWRLRPSCAAGISSTLARSSEVRLPRPLESSRKRASRQVVQRGKNCAGMWEFGARGGHSPRTAFLWCMGSAGIRRTRTTGVDMRLDRRRRLAAGVVLCRRRRSHLMAGYQRQSPAVWAHCLPRPHVPPKKDERCHSIRRSRPPKGSHPTAHSGARSPHGGGIRSGGTHPTADDVGEGDVAWRERVGTPRAYRAVPEGDST
jgi:hypothetical protein